MTDDNRIMKGSSRDGRKEGSNIIRKMMERYSKEIKAHKVT